MDNFNKRSNKSKTLDSTNIEAFSTDPWANAQRAHESIVDTIAYSDLSEKFIGSGSGLYCHSPSAVQHKCYYHGLLGLVPRRHRNRENSDSKQG